jgi:hypothetical protein
MKSIEEAKKKVSKIVNESTVDSKIVIARYTAAVAVNFTDWIGKTLPWVRHEVAYCALVDNMRCESVNDHVGMLLNFATLSNAMPGIDHYEYVSNEVAAIRAIFSDVATSGLAGVALCAVLENTSEVFIPDLAKRAKNLGCTDFTYTDVHGEADIEHSEAFTKATVAELEMGYVNGEKIIQRSVDLGTALIEKIYR